MKLLKTQVIYLYIQFNPIHSARVMGLFTWPLDRSRVLFSTSWGYMQMHSLSYFLIDMDSNTCVANPLNNRSDEKYIRNNSTTWHSDLGLTLWYSGLLYFLVIRILKMPPPNFLRIHSMVQKKFHYFLYKYVVYVV